MAKKDSEKIFKKVKMTDQEILDIISSMNLANVGEVPKVVVRSNKELEITSTIVEEIVTKLSLGKNLRDIRKEVKGSSGESLSWGQIKKIIKLREQFLASLSEEV